MNTRADRVLENKNTSIAGAISQRQGGGKTASRFLDNRPEAGSQRSLQDMANNGPQAGQAAQFQAMADAYSRKGGLSADRPPSGIGISRKQPIQGMFAFQNTTFSENAQLAIKNGITTELYVDETKAGPAPASFFTQSGTEKLNFGDSPTKGEKTETVSESEAYLSKNFNKFVPKASFTKESPKSAFQGVNDCGAYACALNTGDPADWDRKKATGILNKPKADYQPKGLENADKDPSISADVGETYLIQWQGEQEASKAHHHAATTVARDGADHVTSEAHVGKPELQMPEFHMYGSGNNNFYAKHQDYFTKKGGESPYLAIIGSQKK